MTGQKTKKNIGVLYSGGLDSATLIGYYLKKGFEVWPIFIRAGLRWEKIEHLFATKYLKALTSPRLKKLTTLRISLENSYDKNWSKRGKTPGTHSSDQAVYLPARNLLLISKASLFLFSHQINRIAIASLKGNPFPDGKRSYFNLLQKILSRSFKRKIKILTPFRNFGKLRVIRTNKDLPLHLTFSCLTPKGIHHCGKCNKCAERMRAFKKAGVPDRTKYAG